MRIINKQELACMKNGTVFMEYVPDTVNGEIHIITGHYEKKSVPKSKGIYENRNGWNGELSLIPCWEKDLYECFSSWGTNDTSMNDYDDNQLFAIFSKTEVIQMIECLQWALTGCESYFNDGMWHDSNNSRPLTDSEVLG